MPMHVLAVQNYFDAVSCIWYIRPTETGADSEIAVAENEPASLYVFPTVLLFTELDLEDGFDWIFIYGA